MHSCRTLVATAPVAPATLEPIAFGAETLTAGLVFPCDGLCLCPVREGGNEYRVRVTSVGYFGHFILEGVNGSANLCIVFK